MVAERAVADALWEKVSQDLRAEGAHQAFLEHCARFDLLSEAARRYREVKDALAAEEPQRAEDDELRILIDKRLAAIAMLAMAQLEARRTEPASPRSRRWLTLIAAVIAIGSTGVLLWSLL